MSGDSLELNFSLEAKPEIALITLIHAGNGESDKTPSVSVQLNDANQVAVLQVTKAESREFDVSDAVKVGNNSIKVDVNAGGGAYLVSKVELRVYLPEDELRKEKTRANTARKKYHAQLLKAEKEKRRKSNGKKTTDKWPPVIVIGQNVSLFNGRDLSCWQTHGQGTWTVKDGEIVGINNSSRPVRLVTKLSGQESWRDYEFEIEVLMTRGELYVGVHGTIGGNGGFNGSEIGPNLQLNSLTRVRVRVEGNVMHIRINDKPEVKTNGNIRFPVGAPYISVEPNSELHVKSVKFTLKSK
jgi:hypothetical protein